MLAGELALAGVDVAVVERRPNQDLHGSRAGGLQSRTIEVLDQRGIADRFLSEGQTAQVAGFGGTRLDISDFPTRHPYGLGLWQKHIERILAGWVAELKVPVHYGIEVTGFSQDDAGTDVALSDGQRLRAEYLVGCDGGRSVVRKGAGIEFPGWDPTTSALLAEVEMTEEPELGIRRTPSGTHALGKVEYEIKDGAVVYKPGGTSRGHADRVRGRHERAHPARSSRGSRRRVRDRLPDPQSHLDHQVHRRDPAGSCIPQGTGPAGRRRSARPFPGGWSRAQYRCAGCGECGMEAGPGRPRDSAGTSARYLPCRAPPGRCPRTAHHHGAGRADAYRRSHRGVARQRVRAPRHGRASPTICRNDVRTGTFATISARATRCSDAGCPISTW